MKTVKNLTGRELASVILITGMLVTAVPFVLNHTPSPLVMICLACGTILILGAAAFYGVTIWREIEHQ